MTRLQLVVYEYARGINLDLSNRATSAKMSRGKHGDLRLDVAAVMDRDEAFVFYTLAGTPTVELNAGPLVIWRGRAEKITARDGLLTIGAMGQWRATADVEDYTALWSDASYAEWQKIADELIATSASDQYELDNNNRLYLAPRHGETIAAGDGGYWGYIVPDGGRRDLVVVQFKYTLVGSTFTARLQSRTSAWASPSSLWSLGGTAGNQSGAKFITFTAAAALTFEHTANSGTSVTNTGSKFLKITGLRVATSTDRMVNTTYGSNITAGDRTITPTNMTNIYPGQQLVITGAVGTSEMVRVTGITSTTFDATFASNHTATVTIQGIVVHGDEIVEDVLGAVRDLNPDQLSASTILIESPGVDMVDAVYLDRRGMTVIEDIAQRGDGEGNAWETGVYGDVLYLRPLGDDGLTWAVDAEIELERDVARLANQVKAVHKNGKEELRRTIAAADEASAEQWGLTRSRSVDVHTTLADEAELVRDVVVAAQAEPAPRVTLDFDLVYSTAGVTAEKWLQNGGDVLVARNVAITTNVPPDNTASFRISRADYDILRDRMKVEVESVSLVNQLAGVGESTDRAVVNGRRQPFLIAAKG